PILVSGPIVGRRRPDLVTRLRRLDPDAWVAEDQVWAEGILGSLSEDLARAVGRVVGRIGLIAPHELSRTLMQADLGLSAREFYQDKFVTALGLEAVLFVANLAFERLGL